MDALLASAGPSRPPRPSSSNPHAPKSRAHLKVSRGPTKDPIDASTHSILSSTRLPKLYHTSNLATGSGTAPPRPAAHLAGIKDKKLRARLGRQDVGAQQARRDRREVDEWVNRPAAGLVTSHTGSAGAGGKAPRGEETGGGRGGIEVDEEEGERTWRVRQEEIGREVGLGAGQKRWDLKMENLGSYKVDYTRNGR